MQKILILLVGIFIGNALMNLGSSKKEFKSSNRLSSQISGEFNKPASIVKTASLNTESRKPASVNKLKPSQLKAGSLDQSEVDHEISSYFGDQDESDDEISLGSAYRAEIRQESRKLRKKLIRR